MGGKQRGERGKEYAKGRGGKENCGIKRKRRKGEGEDITAQ